MVIRSSREKKRVVEEPEHEEGASYQFRWIRSALLESPADLNAAIEFGTALGKQTAEKYGLAVELCYDVFGQRVYWQMNFDTIDEINAMKEQLQDDADFTTLVQEAHDLWRSGSYRETIVSVINVVPQEE